METTVDTLARPYAPAHDEARATTASWHAYAVVVAAICTQVGVYWDISWHMSIGRDSFWTPAHLLIQAGGLIAGLGSGWVALRTTFRGTEAERAASVGFWGFRAPLGAWVCIWGCFAMLTSAPFDNWWHDAYGLDVKIISPPHTILALGIVAITVGALLLTLARQNQAEEGSVERRRFAVLFVVSAGMMLMNQAIFMLELSDKEVMHSGWFFLVVSRSYPLVLLAAARGSRLRWPATATAAVYMGTMLLLMWTIRLLPAEPKLGPIYQRVTHMVTLDFPLLLVAPALAIDVVMHRLAGRVRDLALAPILAAAFLAAFVAVQWPFAWVLISEHSRNWFFNGDNYYYALPPHAVQRSFHFATTGRWAAPLLGPMLLVALLAGTVSSYVGLEWGRWMSRVRR